MESKKFTLNKVEWGKIGKGLLIAMAGAGLTFLQDTIPNIDFGTWTPIIVSINSVLVNTVRKWLQGWK